MCATRECTGTVRHSDVTIFRVSRRSKEIEEGKKRCFANKEGDLLGKCLQPKQSSSSPKVCQIWVLGAPESNAHSVLTLYAGSFVRVFWIKTGCGSV